jgi:GAF domain-containing protein
MNQRFLNSKSIMENNDETAAIRNRILQVILYGILVFGAVGLITSLPAYFQRGNFWLAIFLIVGYLWTIGITVLHQLPYRIRAINLLSIIYVLSVMELVQNGIAGEGRLFLIALLTLALVLLDMRAALIATGASLVAIAVIGYGMVNSYIPLPGPNDLLFSYNSIAWINGTIVILMVTAAVGGALMLLSRGLETALQHQKQLTKEISEERNEIEAHLEERTAQVDRRLKEIQIVSEINSSISGLFDMNELLQQAVDRIQQGFDLYYAGVFLVESTNRYAVLHAGTGEAGRQMVANHHRLSVDTNSMIGWAVSQKQSRIALDVGQEAVRFNNPYLPLTRSEMALPIISRNECLGALTIQSVLPNAFDDGDIAVLRGIADGLAVAFENSRLYENIQQNLKEIKSLNRQYLRQAWTSEETASGKITYTYQNPLAQVSEENGNLIEIPITVREQVIGRITLETGEQDLQPEEKAFINSITTQTALALENARLLAETQRHANEEEMLNQMSTRLSQAVDVETILRAALQELGKIPGVSEVSVNLANPQMLAEDSTDHAPVDPSNN